MIEEKQVKTRVYENSYIDRLFAKNRGKSAEEILAEYEKRQEKKELFSLEFDFSSPEGDLISDLSCGVKVVMLKSDTDNELVRLYKPDARLELEYSVVVKSINRETKTIYVSSEHEKDDCKKDLLADIDEGIANKEYLILPAVITRVVPQSYLKDSIVFIDIARLGIFGIVRLKEWSSCFTKSFDYCASVGDVINVAVVSKTAWKTGVVYNCSRRLALVEDPWKDIEQHLPKYSKIKVICTEKRKNNFFGIIKGVNDINILCEYPDDPKIKIEENHRYVGFVYKVSEKKHIIAARIVSEIKSIEDDKEAEMMNSASSPDEV